MFDTVSIDSCRMLIQTLGHSLWQASVVAVCCWLVLRSLPASKADLRYGVACAGLFVVVLATLMTAATFSEEQNRSVTSQAVAGQSSALVPSRLIQPKQGTPTGEVISGRVREGHDAADDLHSQRQTEKHRKRSDETHSRTATVDVNQPSATSTTIRWPAVIAGVWVFGVCVMLLRLVRAIVALRYLQSSQSSASQLVPSQLNELVKELSVRMKLRWPVDLVVSDRVSVPGIVGTFWPTLLMPPAMLTGVPVEQLRIVIAHELAHVKRFDFLVNLGQLLVESLLFFNPAVWWLSRQVRIEREACCDAIAVEATGSAMPVARTLLAIVDQPGESPGSTSARRLATATGMQALSGDNSPQTPTPLFDRIRRIVTPEQRPHIRIPWYSLPGVIAAYALISIGLYEGADATVQAVQRVLSPKERVEKIEELIASQGDLARREGVSIAEGSAEDPPGSKFPEPVTVSGVVRTSDGGPLPAPLSVFGTFSGPGISGSEGFGNLDEPSDTFRFSGKTRSQRSVRGDIATLSLHVGWRGDSPAAKRYAPVAIGPFEVRSGQSLKDIEIILEPGFSGQLRVLSRAMKPVGNAFVSGMFHLDNVSSYSHLNPSRSRTGSDGMTSIPRSSSKLIWTGLVRAKGFQTDKFDLTLQKDQVAEVKLKVARPTTLKLTSHKDGQPVAGAWAYLVQERATRNGQQSSLMLPDPREDDGDRYEEQYAGLYRYGPSDTDGRLVLDSLTDGTEYDLLVRAPGLGPSLVNDVTAGNPARAETLSPALSVSGQILGDLSTLRSDPKTKRRYFQYCSLDSNLFQRVAVEERDGKGHFRIDNLGRGDLWLHLPDRRIARELTESIEDFVIDLNQPGSYEYRSPSRVKAESTSRQELTTPTRKVILTLVGGDSAVALTGKIRAGFIPRNRLGAYVSSNHEIVSSRVEFDVEVPTRIHWMGKDFSGYSVVRKSEIEVGVSDEPFRADVQLMPAGAVRGEVRLADGSLARRFQVDVMPLEQVKSFSRKNQNVSGGQAPGEFLLTDIPLGHRYQALISDDRVGSVAAIMSEPFLLDDEHPIADLKFQFKAGRVHIIRLVNEDREPAAGAKAGGWFYPNNKLSRSAGFRADENGVITLKNISDSIPGRVELHVKYAGGFVGQVLPLDWNNLPQTLVLKRGVSASGRIVDAETGRGIAKAGFHLYPLPSNAASSAQAIVSSTDEQGAFSFDSLEPINYQLHLYGAVPPRVPLVKNDRGNLEPDYTNIKDGTFPEWFVYGGKSEPYIIKVKIVPKHGLKLAPALDEVN